jgi:hypothetical protein
MKKRTRKPPVEPALAREWLRRNEDLGESVAEIARTAHYDVRTVKKQLECMLQEREARQARQLVLKGALENHYADLCALAERVRADLAQFPPKPVSPLDRDDPLWTGLKEHLSRTPVWRDIDKFERLITQYEAAIAAIRARIEKEAESLTSMKVVPSGNEVGLLPSFSQGMAFHLEAGVRGFNGLASAQYATRDSEFGIIFRLGSYSLAVLPGHDAKAESMVKDACSVIMESGVTWEEHAAMAKVVKDIQSVQKNLNDELTKVILRRVLPGRCTYCPY